MSATLEREMLKTLSLPRQFFPSTWLSFNSYYLEREINSELGSYAWESSTMLGRKENEILVWGMKTNGNENFIKFMRISWRWKEKKARRNSTMSLSLLEENFNLISSSRASHEPQEMAENSSHYDNWKNYLHWVEVGNELWKDLLTLNESSGVGKKHPWVWRTSSLNGKIMLRAFRLNGALIVSSGTRKTVGKYLENVGGKLKQRNLMWACEVKGSFRAENWWAKCFGNWKSGKKIPEKQKNEVDWKLFESAPV
jgi:hypothetical protein